MPNITDRFNFTDFADLLAVKGNFTNIGNRLDSQDFQLADLAVVPARYNGETDDTNAIKRAILLGKKIHINKDYVVNTYIALPSDIEIYGNGKITSTNSATDILVLYGSDTNGNEIHNVKIKGITLVGGRYGIQVYGRFDVTRLFNYLPHDITIENINTVGTQAGGIYLNSCHDIKVLDCSNDGGNRHVGIESPLGTQASYNILIDGCNTKNTDQFGYQAYYSKDIIISNCTADGSLETSGDKSCITIDRTKNVVLTNNTCKNSPESNIFVTGAEKVTVNGNFCSGGKYGVQVCYNLEAEDLTVKESLGVTVSDNICVDTLTGIIFNGVKYGTISSNVLKNLGTRAIQIQTQTRAADSVAMATDNIIVTGNNSDSGIQLASLSQPVILMGNMFTTYTGVKNTDIVVDKNSNISLGRQEIDNLGLIKRDGMADDQVLFNFLLTAATYKGMIWQYTNGLLNLKDSAGTTIFQLQMGSATPGNLFVVQAGKGITLKSPDGLVTKTVTINNSGVITLV